MDDEMTLSQAVAAHEPADDVTDLDTARRLVTALRKKISALSAEYEEMTSPVEGEYTAFLSEEHATKLRWLYQARKLFHYEPEHPYWLDPPELDEAFTDFVESMIDVVWDTAQVEQGDRPQRPPVA